MSATVTVIIVNWNGAAYLRGCLGSLRAQSFRDFETLIVDNASTDDSPAVVREEFPEVRLVINEANLGFAGGNNVGIRHANSALLAFLNNDTEADANWLRELVAAVEGDRRVAGCCGKTHQLEDRDKVIFTIPKIDHRSGRAYWINADAPRMTVDYLAGTAMLVRRDVIDEIGLLDEAYFAYYEETDWCARMIRAGYDLLYVPTAVVWHKSFGSASLDFNYLMMHRNRLRFGLKNFDDAYVPGFLALYLRDVASAAIQNWRRGSSDRNALLLKAVGWNLRHLPGTIRARRELHGRSNRRPYNRSLPLRNIVADGKGGYHVASRQT